MSQMHLQYDFLGVIHATHWGEGHLSPQHLSQSLDIVETTPSNEGNQKMS